MAGKLAAVIAGAGGALLFACGLAHRGAVPAPRQAPPVRVRAAAVESPAPAEIPPAGDFRTGADRPLPSELRRQAIERTGVHLGWGPAKQRELLAVSEGAVQEISSAWSIREAELRNLPADLDPGDWNSRLEQIDGRYGEVKRSALARIEALLEPSRDAERLFLERLEEWFDEVR